MTHHEAVTWLFGVTRFGMKLGLDNTRALLALYDLPDPHLRLIHVAGTNGKGSTSAFAHAVLHASGHTAGLFTSPHLIDFRERIRVGSDLISESDTARLLTDLRGRCEQMPQHPSFFEIAFALALIHFREAKAEFAVIETGLGGRLDATNVITPVVSALTPVGMDHQHWLGETLAEIAAEKAGIIKPGIPVVTAPQHPDALTVIQNQAARQSASITVIDPGTYPPTSSLGLKGEHQRQNAALAVSAIQAAGILLPESAIASGLRDVTWPARFQILSPPQFSASVVIDGAHNSHAARALRETWQTEFPGQKATLIYSATEGKDAPQFLSELLPVVGEIILTKSHSSRAREPEDLRAEWEPVCPNTTTFQIAPTSESALTKAKQIPRPILVAGSLFLAGDILAILQKSDSPHPSESL